MCEQLSLLSYSTKGLLRDAACDLLAREHVPTKILVGGRQCQCPSRENNSFVILLHLSLLCLSGDTTHLKQNGAEVRALFQQVEQLIRCCWFYQPHHVPQNAAPVPCDGWKAGSDVAQVKRRCDLPHPSGYTRLGRFEPDCVTVRIPIHHPTSCVWWFELV